MRMPLHRLQFVVVNLLVLTTGGLLAFSCNESTWTGSSDMHQSPSGFYLGTFTSTLTPVAPNRDTIGMISEEFEAQFLLARQHYSGLVSVDMSTLSGDLTEYRGRLGVFVGIDGLSTVSLDGQVTEREGVFGTYEGDDAQGRFALTYSAAYEEGSSLELLAGVWSYSEAASGGGVYSISLGIEETGELFGSDTAGCVFDGQLGIIDSLYSVYRTTVTVTSCDIFAGDYRGLAFYPGTGDVLHLATDSGQFAFAIQVERL